MKKKLLPLKNLILYLILTLGICIIVVLIYSVQSYSKLLTNTIKNNQELYTKQVLQSTEKNLTDIKNIASSIAYNQSVQRYLVEENSENKFELYQQVINLLNNSKVINNSILDISLIGETSNTANLLGDISVYRSLYFSIPKSGSSTLQFLDKTSLIVNDTDYKCQIVAFPIYKLSNTNSSFIGVLFVTINPSSILGEYLYDENLVPTELMFANSSQQLILGDEKLFGEIQKTGATTPSFNISYNNQSYICWQLPVNISNGTIYTLVNQSVYTEKIMKTLLPQLILIIMVFMIMVIILLALLKKITDSFRQLTDIMNKISNGKRKALQERITIDNSRHACLENYLIANSFNEMMDEINRLNHDIFDSYTKMYELEVHTRKAELAYLRSQINPHFLYNTLTLICGMASENKTDNIIDITQALSRIYRYSIGNDIVSVEQELDIIKSYVMIQTTRFENRFSVSYDFLNDVQNALIPRMIIQPLVENAMKHGLEKCLRKGSLTIGGRRNYEDNTLVLWVYDTGVGMTTERLSYVRHLLQESAYSNSSSSTKTLDIPLETSIGLPNVNSRINLFYGEPYRLHIDSEENVGTNILIKIPFNSYM